MVTINYIALLGLDSIPQSSISELPNHQPAYDVLKVSGT
jgi:hypothetical protein